MSGRLSDQGVSDKRECLTRCVSDWTGCLTRGCLIKGGCLPWGLLPGEGVSDQGVVYDQGDVCPRGCLTRKRVWVSDWGGCGCLTRRVSDQGGV